MLKFAKLGIKQRNKIRFAEVGIIKKSPKIQYKSSNPFRLLPFLYCYANSQNRLNLQANISIGCENVQERKENIRN